MTPLDIISAHLELSIDEISAILHEADYVSFRLEMNIDQLYEERMDTELNGDQITMVEGRCFRMVPQTPLSLIIVRLGGFPEANMRRVLNACNAVAFVMSDSFQQWFTDEHYDASLEDWDFTEDEIRAALVGI